MLVMADRNFLGYDRWAAAATGADLLWRAKSDTRLPVVTELPDGSYLSYLVAPGTRGRGKRIPVRVIEYTLQASGSAHPHHHLATLDRRTIVFDGQKIEKLTTPTPVQRRAFELLGTPVPLTLQ